VTTQSETTVPAAEVKPPSSVKKYSKKKTRRTYKKKSSLARAGAAKPVTRRSPSGATPVNQTGGAAGYGRLVGAYVSMQLTNGNEVKGILKDVTATEYKLEVPGLGDFIYQQPKVKSVELAK